MLKFAAKLTNDREYGLVGWGQSNAAPQGTRAEGLAANPQLTLSSPGLAVTGVVVSSTVSGTFTVGTALTASAWVGAELRLGTVTVPLAGYGTITANATGTVTLAWTSPPASTGTFEGYICFRDDRHKSYANVRVLTAYQPEAVGGYPSYAPSIAGYSVPSSVTSYEDLGLFLPLTMLEGVASCGVTGTGTYGALVVTCTTGIAGYIGITDDVFIGGYLYVLDPATGNSWKGDITDSTGSATTPSFTVASFTASNAAAPTPPTGAGAITFEVHLPHYANNPYHYSPGPGFRYPNNYTTPAGPLLNRAAGVTTAAYADRIGVLLPLAWRLSNQLGKRINVTWLGISASSIMRTGTLFGGPSKFGWWDSSVHLDWLPEMDDGLSARMERLLTMGPNALLAEGSTKTLKNVGIIGFQGEAEAGNAVGRTLYETLLPSFYEWLIRKVELAGTSFYAAAGKMPLMHALVASYPWDLVDTDGLVNLAIQALADRRPFASTIDTNDSERNGEIIHFSGAGEVTNGDLAADAILGQIDAAVSSEEDEGSAAVVAICNTALSFIGETARVTSLNPTADESTQAARCKTFYVECRQQLLQRCSWSFATRRAELVALSGTRTDEWPYAYAIPNNAVRVFAVLPPGAGDDYSLADRDYMTLQDGGTRRFVTNSAGYVPQPFTIETDSDGCQVIYARIENAVARYNVQVSDARAFSPLFTEALAFLLASKLAGATIKGAEGAAMAQRCLGFSERALGEARVQDAVQRDIKPEPRVSWMAARRG